MWQSHTALAASWFRGGRYVHDVHAEGPAVESVDGELVLASDGD